MARGRVAWQAWGAHAGTLSVECSSLLGMPCRKDRNMCATACGDERVGGVYENLLKAYRGCQKSALMHWARLERPGLGVCKRAKGLKILGSGVSAWQRGHVLHGAIQPVLQSSWEGAWGVRHAPPHPLVIHFDSNKQRDDDRCIVRVQIQFVLAHTAARSHHGMDPTVKLACHATASWPCL